MAPKYDIHVEVVSTSFQKRMVWAWCEDKNLFKSAILSKGGLEGLIYHVSVFIKDEVTECVAGDSVFNVVVNQNECFRDSGLEKMCADMGCSYEVRSNYFMSMAKISKHLPLRYVNVDVSFVEYHYFSFMWCYAPGLDDFYVSPVLSSFSSVNAIPWSLKVRALAYYLDKYYVPVVIRMHPDYLCVSRDELDYMLFQRGSILSTDISFDMPRDVIRRHRAKRRSKAMMRNFVQGCDE